MQDVKSPSLKLRGLVPEASECYNFLKAALLVVRVARDGGTEEAINEIKT